METWQQVEEAMAAGDAERGEALAIARLRAIGLGHIVCDSALGDVLSRVDRDDDVVELALRRAAA